MMQNRINDNIVGEKKVKLISISDIGFIKTDINGGIIEINNISCIQTGYEYKELIEMNISDFITDIQKEEITSFIKRMYEERGYKFELSYLNKKGDILPVTLTATKKGRYIYNNISTSTTEKNIQKDLLQNSTEKYFFLPNISHELRTPMNAIVNFGNMLNDKSFNNNEKKEFISIINNNCSHLLNTVDNLAYYSMVRNNELIPEKVNFNLNKLIIDLYDEHKVDAKKKRIKLKINMFEINPDSTITTDYKILKKTISCIVDNAIKFTEHGDIELVCMLEESLVNFWIVDKGIGIPKEKQALIFKEFKQIDESLTRAYGGMGIGLTLACSFIKLLNGKYKLTSSRNEGTTFYIQIPIV
ncbi:PAS domain-containing sensor histidine kinase [Labilibacter sediminis]|nr:PAS domain-containing sensor histidine kinase [Labilibacter sediminis]